MNVLKWEKMRSVKVYCHHGKYAGRNVNKIKHTIDQFVVVIALKMASRTNQNTPPLTLPLHAVQKIRFIQN